jgi:Polysaccharide lyase family 8, super-sandwich domain/Polysaccharide lyase family 8, C-terminal beta-sandwich domain
MRYTNPVTGSLHWQKAWFFLDGDVLHTMISGLNSTTSAPVYTVLDQRLHNGSVIIDGVQTNLTNSTDDAQIETLWHGNVGYLFPRFSNPINISVSVGKKKGSWSAIGISSQPPTTVDLFTARIEHNSTFSPVEYTTFPGTSYDTFSNKSSGLQLRTIQNDQNISALFDEGNNTAMVVFWDAGGGSVTFNPVVAYASITISSDGNIALLYRLETGEVTVSDPSQSLTRSQVTIALGPGVKPPHWKISKLRETLNFNYPSGGAAGSSVSQTFG